MITNDDNHDDGYINDDDDDDDAGGDDYDGDDDDSGPCPIFPIRLRRLPDHRADGTTGLMIDIRLLRIMMMMMITFMTLMMLTMMTIATSLMISIIIKVPNMQWQAWWIIRPPVEHNCRSQSEAQHY